MVQKLIISNYVCRCIAPVLLDMKLAQRINARLLIMFV